MSVNELLKLVGREALATWRTRAGAGQVLRVPVKTTDARVSFGNEQVQIEPIGGEGRAWVDLSTITFSDEGPVSGLLP